MALPSNTLQQVQTYQDSQLAFLQNYGCFVSTSNSKFKDFDKAEANLGSAVTFDLPPRYLTTNTLVADFQPSVQRVQTLTANQAVNTSYAFSTEQFIFNVRDYMDKFGKSAVMEIASHVEANIALNATSAVVDNVPTSPTFGLKDSNSGPYRFYGDGTTDLNSFGQLARMLANYRNYGAPRDNLRVYLPDTIIPDIVNTGLTQFVLDRNEKEADSWMVGNWQGVDYYQSNLLPTHTAGNVGIDATVLTVVSTNDATGNNVTQINFSGAGATDADAIKEGDLLEFSDGVAGQPNMRFLTFVGHVVSSQPVQFRATADAASDGGGLVTVAVTPALVWKSDNANQNVNNAIAAGMQCTALPSHQAGLVVSGNAMYMAMPSLPDQPPFPTSSKSDPDTGVSMRLTYGTLFGQNQQGFINDVVWGSTLVPEYSMRVIVPLTQ